MKHVVSYAILLVGVLLATSCEKESDSIFSRLSIRLIMPDNRQPQQLLVMQESAFFNLNSHERVALPCVINNRFELRLRKGVYTFKIEARAVYGPGDTVLMRNTDHNQPTQAVTWVGDEESVVLSLNRI